MRRIAGCLALLLCAPLMTSAQDTVSQEDYQRTLRRLHETEQRQMDLQTALNNTRLHQLAMVVHFTSEGNSSLMLGSGVSAIPQLGRVLRMSGWRNAPFITVYPASSPRPARLPDYGECRILGAVGLLVGASVSGAGHCEAGDYLLALRTPANGAQTLSLLDVQADDHGAVHYREVLQTPVERLEPDNVKSPPVKVVFPGRDETSQDHPAWQAKVEFPEAALRVRFRLNLDITML